jgi:bifunctional non-homologous end joining protein LigD
MSLFSARPGFIEPQLATPVDKPPLRSGWIHEVKHDGYRTLLVAERGNVRAFTRNGFDWSDRYPGVVQAATNLKCRSAILDGEVIVQDEHGVSDFEALMSAIRWQPHRLIYYVFDLLHLDGKDLRDRPLIERRATLKELLQRQRSQSPLQFSDEFTGDPAAFFQACANHRLEGTISKLATSRYRSGRSKTWLKCKCFTESSFVIIGTDRDRKTGALMALLARAEDQGLSYAGSAFVALPGSERGELLTRLDSARVDSSPVPQLRVAGRPMGKATAQGSRAPSGRHEKHSPRDVERVRLSQKRRSPYW